MSCEEFDLGQDVVLRKAFGHLMSPLMMAFAPASTGKPHPTPYAVVHGSMGIDMHLQLFIPKTFTQKDWFDRVNTAWWITSLLRMRLSPAITMPVLSDRPFAMVPGDWQNAQLFSVEPMRKRILPETELKTAQELEDLRWIRDNWIKGGRLMSTDSNFNAAYQAFDFSSHAGSVALSLLTVWGALEQLFAHAKQELRFRVSASIASYLEDQGAARLSLQKKIQKLYDARSSAAHSVAEVEHKELVESYAILRQCLLKMIESGAVPSRTDLEQRLFG